MKKLLLVLIATISLLSVTKVSASNDARYDELVEKISKNHTVVTNPNETEQMFLDIFEESLAEDNYIVLAKQNNLDNAKAFFLTPKENTEFEYMVEQSYLDNTEALLVWNYQLRAFEASTETMYNTFSRLKGDHYVITYLDIEQDRRLSVTYNGKTYYDYFQGVDEPINILRY